MPGNERTAGGNRRSEDQAASQIKTDNIGPGASVRLQRAAPSKGSWSLYAGRTGTVVEIRRVSPAGQRPAMYEIGVDLTSRGHTDAWFLPSEIAVQAPGCVLTAATDARPQSPYVAGAST